MWLPKALQSPSRLLVLVFLALIAVGTVLLMLPISGSHSVVGLVDALFTSTSAGCVTGLTVLDTGKDFSLFGQIVILLLIQLGGLGITTISSALVLAIGRRPSLVGHLMLIDTFTAGGEFSLRSLLKDIMIFTFAIEGLGALLLFVRFLPGRSLVEALFISVFHSIAAFCNAGFSLFSDNLMQFRGDWVVNLTIGFLIITGGIGFLVLAELKQKIGFRNRRWSRLSLHSKMVLSTTGILILVGMIFFLILEWNNTLYNLPIHEKLLASFFQSVTPRTAGFNTLPYGVMSSGTLLITIILMFIGASSGSCGGGIKTGTFATLMTWGLSRFRGHEIPQAFHRTISETSMKKAIGVVIVSLLVVLSGTLILTMSELSNLEPTESRGKFIEILFETVSAFGTVGLSTGVTPDLSIVGKLVITTIMFVGRLSPVVLAVAISHQHQDRYRFAEENIMIG